MTGDSTHQTEPDESRQFREPTEEQKRQLYRVTDAQRIAAEAVVAGLTTSEAAERSGVTRQTVSGWRNHHPAFKALVNRLRRNAHSLWLEQMRVADQAAVGVLLAAIQEGDIQAALAWLRLRPITKSEEPSKIGAIDPEQILEENARDYQAELQQVRRDAISDRQQVIDFGDAMEALEIQTIYRLNGVIN